MIWYGESRVGRWVSGVVDGVTGGQGHQGRLSPEVRGRPVDQGLSEGICPSRRDLGVNFLTLARVDDCEASRPSAPVVHHLSP